MNIYFFGHSKIPHQRKIIKNASLTSIKICHLIAKNSVSFVSRAALSAAILDFNEN